MHRHILFFIGFVFVVRLRSLVAQDLADRLAHFDFQKADVSEGFSVLIEKISIVEDVVTVDEVAGKKERQLSSNRTFQRIVFGPKGLRRRMDGLEYSLFDGQQLNDVAREAELIHENEGWYFRNSRTDSPNKSLSRYQVRAGVFSSLARTRWKHPFYSATTNAGGMLSSKEREFTNENFRTLNHEQIRDGREKFTAVGEYESPNKFTFNKEEGWMVEEVEFLMRNETKEELLANSKGAKPKTVTVESLKEYFPYALNRTEWKEVEKNTWVPWVTRIQSKTGDFRVEFEIRFRDWKFMGDVDDSLLDEANFTTEKIPASIDFKAIRDVFDSTK